MRILSSIFTSYLTKNYNLLYYPVDKQKNKLLRLNDRQPKPRTEGSRQY